MSGKEVPVIDMERWRIFVTIFDGETDKSGLEENYLIFRTRSDSLILKMEDALRTGNNSLFVQSSHSVVGTALNSGFARVLELSQRMELADINANPALAASMLQNLKLLLDEALQEMKRLIDAL